MTNKEKFLSAANAILLAEENGITRDINIRRKSITDIYDLVLFNASKKLIYDGYNKDQEQLKGLIVKVNKIENKAVEVISGCFPKFYNFGEGNERNQYKEYFTDDIYVDFAYKEDGVNIRPFFCEITNQVEFSTRGTILGRVEGIDEEEDKFTDFGYLARTIAEEKYPILFNKEFNDKYSCVFEMIHPECQIITDYKGDRNLILLAAFDKQNDFQELTRYELIKLATENKLDLVFKWMVDINTKDFNSSIEILKERWADSDLEGTVAVFCDKKTYLPLYRLKIKNAHYLELLKLSQFCTQDYTVELCKSNGFKLWEEFKKFLYESDAMTEELEMMYKVYYDIYEEWQDLLNINKYYINDEFKQLMQKFSMSDVSFRKDFALSISGNEWKSILFKMLDYYLKNNEMETFWRNCEQGQTLLEKWYSIEEFVKECKEDACAL